MAVATRPDGRRADELRPISIQTGYLKFPLGAVLIQAGDTRVLCAASVQDTVPDFLLGRKRGWVTAEYNMLRASTPTRKARENAGHVDGRTQEIRRLIGRTLRAVVDLEQLGERTIYIDCDVLQADGGTRTLAVSGAWVALALAVRKLRASKRLCVDPIRAQLAAVSVGMINGRCLLDLSYAEDSKADVDMNVALTNKGEFVEIQGAAEASPFDEKKLFQMLGLARNGCKRLMSIRQAALRNAGKALS